MILNGYHSIHDEWKPYFVQGLSQGLMKLLEVNLRSYNGEHILLGDQFTLTGAKMYCESLGGYLYEPKNDLDMAFLYHTASTYELSEIWIGVYWSSISNNWRYYSNSSQIIPEVIYEKIDQDNGASFVGKSERYLFSAF